MFDSQMQTSQQSFKYHTTRCRATRPYLVFQLCQLILSIIIVITAIASHHLFRQKYVLILEFILLLSMAIDLFVIRMCSSGLCQNRSGKIDTCIFFVFLATFIFMAATQSKIKKKHGEGDQYQILLQIDDIVVICIIVIRYAVQIYQMVNTIQETQNNVDCQNNINNFDLNKEPYASIMDENNNDVLQDEVIREKIKESGRSKMKKEEEFQGNDQ